MKKVKLKCPDCGTEINVDDLLAHQIEQRLKKQANSEAQQKRADLEKLSAKIKMEESELRQNQKEFNSVVSTKIEEGMKLKEKQLKQVLQAKLKEEKSLELKEMQKELVEKSNEVKELFEFKAKVARFGREKDELEQRISTAKEEEFTIQLGKELAVMRVANKEQNELKLGEKQKVINDLNIQLKKLTNQAEQGSVQLQGEVQELQLERMLKEIFPYDDITDIAKGSPGADICQTVRNGFNNECGKIYYESKRTKSFSNSWIPKLKADNREMKADILVLVTQAMPKSIERFGLIEGVWICSYSFIAELSTVLRHGLVKVGEVTSSQTNRASKMELLYNFLTSQEFRGQFESIVEGFKALQDSHHSEKLKMQRLWKQREKQFELILLSTVDFYGSLRGIEGTAIPEVKLLEDNESSETNK